MRSIKQFWIIGIIWSVILLTGGQLIAHHSANSPCGYSGLLTEPEQAISIYSNCVNGRIQFIIINNLGEPSEDFILSIVEDDIIILLKKKVKMNAYETLFFDFPDQGMKYDVILDFNTNSNQTDLIETFYSCINNSNLKKDKTKIVKEIPSYLSTMHNNGPLGISTARHNEDTLKSNEELFISKFYENNGEIKIEIFSSEIRPVCVQILNFQGNQIWSINEELKCGNNNFSCIINEKLNQSLILAVQDRTRLLTKYLLLFY